MADNARSKSAAELEREAERSRVAVIHTLDALHDRLSGTVEQWRGRLTPEEIKKEVFSYASQARSQFVSDLGQRVGNRVVANPLPVLVISGGVAWTAWRILRSIPAPLVVIGGGVAWLMRSSGSDHYDPSDVGRIGDAEPPQPRSAREVVQAAASKLGDSVLDASARAREAVHDAGARVAEQVAQAGATVTGAVERAASSIGGAVGLSSSGQTSGEATGEAHSGGASATAAPAGGPMGGATTGAGPGVQSGETPAAAMGAPPAAQRYGGTDGSGYGQVHRRTSRVVRPRPHRVRDVSALEGWALGGVSLAIGAALAYSAGGRPSVETEVRQVRVTRPASRTRPVQQRPARRDEYEGPESDHLGREPYSRMR